MILLKRCWRQRERLYTLTLAICSFVRLSVAKMHTQKRDFLKTKQFRAGLYWRLTRSPTWAFHYIGPLKFKMADIRHLENHESAVSTKNYAISVTLVHNSIFWTCWQIWTFLSRVSILTRDIDIAIMSVCLPVHPSVTFRYQMKTA